MFTSIILVVLLVATGSALPGGFGGGYGGGYGGGGGGYGGGYNVATPYNFNYGVSSGNTNFGQWEGGNGHGSAKGGYHVHLPDGRLQRVTYWVDGSGYHPVVTYSGTARHPASYGHGGGKGYGYGR